MKKMFVWILMILFLIPVVVLAADNDAAKKTREQRSRTASAKWWEVPQIAKQLNLTEEEKKELGELYADNRILTIELRNDLKKEQKILNEKLRSEDFSARESVSQYKKVQKVQNKLALANFEYRVKIQELLGSERSAKLNSMIRKARASRRDQRPARQQQSPPVVKPAQ